MRWLIATTALVALSCASQPTQLIVVVETNLDVPAELDTVEVAVRGPGGVSTVAPQTLTEPGDPTFPLTLGVMPGADELGPITVTAIARLAGVEVVSQSAEVTLVHGETRVVHLVLYRSCVGRACASGETCDADGCVAELRADLPAWTGTPPTFDDSDPCLALPWDVDDDGQGSATCGGLDCDDTEARAFDGNVEDCDDIDNNCDGEVDEDCDCSPLMATEECTTGCGSLGDRVCEADGWSACAVRPESCNGIDDDCDGLTDEGLTYTASMPTTLTTTDEDSYEPDLVWADDRYGLAWYDDTDRDGVHFLMLDRTGAPMGPASRISDDGRQPALVWTGTTYGVAWWDRDSSTDCCDTTCVSMCTTNSDRIYMTVLDSSGMPASATERVEGNADQEPRPSIVWDGTNFVVGYRDGDMYLEERAADATELGDPYEIPSSSQARFDMVFNGSQVAVVFAAADTISFTVGSVGAFPPMESALGTLSNAFFASVVWTGAGYVVAVNAEEAGQDLFVGGLSSTGVLSGLPTMLSSTVGPGGFFGDPPPPGIASAPGQVLVTWADVTAGTPDIWFARVGPDGTMLQPPTAVAVTPGSSGQTSVAWSGDHFGVVWSEEPTAGANVLRFARIGCSP